MIGKLFNFRRAKNAPRYTPVDLTGYNRVRDSRHIGKACHAPSGSLRFSQAGNVLACCYNRDYVLGNIAQDSLHDIWFGEKAKALRDRIAHNDFSFGCGRCKTDIENGNYLNSGAVNYDYLADYPAGKYPSMLDFETDNTCNFECIMCNGEYSSTILRHREHMPPYEKVYPESFAGQLEEFIPHLKEARFVGGEPFLIDMYYDIWDRIVRLAPGAKISILTNGSVYNNRVKTLLEKGNFEISFSIDSLDPENFARIRQRGQLAVVLENFRNILRIQHDAHKHTSLNTCVMRQNWHEIPDIVRFCNEKKVSLFFHTVHYPFHTSLWNADRPLLEKIGAFYADQTFAAPEGEWAERNIERFRTIVRQTEQWLSRADRIAEQRKAMETLSPADIRERFSRRLLDFYRKTEPDVTEPVIHAFNDKLDDTYRYIPEALLKGSLIEMMFVPEEMLFGEFKNVSAARMAQKLKFAQTLQPENG